jgi:hypothetical protein
MHFHVVSLLGIPNQETARLSASGPYLIKFTVDSPNMNEEASLNNISGFISHDIVELRVV